MEEINLTTLQDLDWVTVTDQTDPDHPSADMEVMNAVELDGKRYVLAAMEASDEEGAAAEDEPQDAFIFMVCSPEEEEFRIQEDYTNLEFSVTTSFPEETFQRLSQIFSDSDQYDLTTEDSDKNE